MSAGLALPPGFHADLPDADHHLQPALGSTDLKNLLRKPARFLHERAHPTPPKPAMYLGSIVHALVLGTGSKYVVSPHEAHRSNDAKQWMADQQAAGVIVVKQKDYDIAQAMADALYEHEVAGALLDRATAIEATAIADVGGVMCKARYDAVIPEAGLDVKTTAEPDLDDVALSRAMDTYHYEIQGGAYADVMAALGEPERDHQLLWVSSVPPHFVAVRRIADTAMDQGRELAATAREIYLRCTETGRWPGPAPYGELDLPRWSYTRTAHHDLLESLT